MHIAKFLPAAPFSHLFHCRFVKFSPAALLFLLLNLKILLIMHSKLVFKTTVRVKLVGKNASSQQIW